MATRGKTTFLKRQKEMARKQKQQDKAERREQRKMAAVIEDNTPSQDPALSSDPEPEETDMEGVEQPAQNWRPAPRGNNNA
jgi:hypothetical protein